MSNGNNKKKWSLNFSNYVASPLERCFKKFSGFIEHYLLIGGSVAPCTLTDWQAAVVLPDVRKVCSVYMVAVSGKVGTAWHRIVNISPSLLLYIHDILPLTRGLCTQLSWAWETASRILKLTCLLDRFLCTLKVHSVVQLVLKYQIIYLYICYI